MNFKSDDEILLRVSHRSHLITIAFRYMKGNMLNLKGEFSEYFHLPVLKGFRFAFVRFFHGSSQFNLFAYIFHSLWQDMIHSII